MLLLILVVFVVGLGVTLSYLIQGPPYVPTDDASAADMARLIKSYKPKHILDMGSGDGRLVVYLAGQGYRVDGVELNPLLVRRSRAAIKRAGLQDRATIHWGNFWRYRVSDYDMVVLYVIKHIMPRLERKLQTELRPGSHVVSNFFVFPTLLPVKSLGRARIYKI